MNDYSKSQSIKVALIPGISLDESAGELSLVSSYGRFPVSGTSVGMMQAFRALAEGRSTETELATMVLESGGIGELSRFSHAFMQCVLRCFVRYSVYDGSLLLMSLQLMVPQKRFEIVAFDPQMSLRLSRFAYSHRDEEGLLLETPMCAAKTILHDWRCSALLAILSEPHTSREICKTASFLSCECLAGALQLLKASRALCICTGEIADEDQNAPLRQWEFHDLLFHSRSRIGRHNHRIGATFRHLGQISPQPLIKNPDEDGFVLPLPPADGQERKMSAFEAIEARRSIRQHAREPINVGQLGEFLYRVARIRGFWDFEITNPEGVAVETVQLSNRPYPAGGAIYEIEIYLTVDRCAGLNSGLYRYRPIDHKLVKVCDANEKTATLLKDACLAAGIKEKPQILITLASRFQRMSWKYEVISYAATLKNVGVLYQTMYLVATGMGLAACGLGSGNSDLFAEAAGTDYYMETSVGEFMLGSAPAREELPPWMKEKDVRPNEMLPAHA